MSQLRNLLVLVVYVLGAHVLPIAHPFLHHHPQQRMADCVAASDCQPKAGGHCCAGHHHGPAAAEHSPAASAASSSGVAADNDCTHRCSETCALCLAGHSPVGAGVAAEGQAKDALLPGIRVAIESSRGMRERRGELPEQRGPPVDDTTELAAA
ncbi:MAG: hypothetical protein ACO1RT_02515 [Planctomycetaceae bacterium]